jgi:hypothetical protein
VGVSTCKLAHSDAQQDVMKDSTNKIRVAAFAAKSGVPTT